jgi:HAD superfamily hydrolase (TIGR01509 family)
MESKLNLTSNIRALALDFDGVITNLDIDWNAALQLASRVKGSEVKSLLTFYKTSHDSPIFQEVSKQMEKLELKALENAEPTPFLTEFLKEISEMQVETYLVSMQTATSIEKFLRRHDLTRCFKEVLTRERFPSKNAEVQYIMDKTRLSPSEILLVDDLEKNITSCRELGIRVFHFIRRQEAAKTRQMWNTVINMVQNQSQEKEC